jgi:hypothetical protein
VLIIDGGASGVMMVAHLLARPDAGFRVTIVEGRHMLGCAIAYSTTDPDHLLNTRAHNMSTFSRPPAPFPRLVARPAGGVGVTDQCFVSRVPMVPPWQACWRLGRVMARTAACAASTRPAFVGAKREGA